MGRLRRLVRRGTEALYKRTHEGAAPGFTRVAYSIPREAVLITAADGGERNVWPIDWHTPVSIDPAMYGIVLAGGYGAELIERSGSFAVHTVDVSWEERILAAGAMSGRGRDKIAELGLEVREGTLGPPILVGVLGVMECRVVGRHPFGDRTIIVGEVVTSTPPPPGSSRLFHVDSGISPR